MSDKASAVAAKAARPNGLAMAALAFLVVAIVVAAAATGPYIFKGATLEGEVAAQLREATGLRMVSSGRASFSLLPSPHLELTDLHLAGPDRALVVDAGALEGDVRLLPLIVGRLELSAATLVRPKLAIDLDAGKMPADSTIGRALHGLAPPAGDTGDRLGTVTIVDGTAELRARALPRPPRLNEINVTIDWPDIDSPATLTGSLMIDDVATDIAAWVAQPSALMRGETSPIALRVHAAPLDLSANGDLFSADKTVFRGHMAMSAPSLSALLARFGDPTRMMAPFANATLNGDTTITIRRGDRTSIDLQALDLDLDGNRYEGALAYESGARRSLSGTLATDTLTIAPFLAAEPSLADAQHRWRRSALVAGGGGLLDLDLRLSATHLKIAPFTIDDAALSVMTRGTRTEVGLNDGKAYGGAIKGRASIGVADGSVSLRGAGTLEDADIAGLSWDLLGRQVAAGTLSGALNIDTSGNSPAALMAHLQGWAKGRARDGELSGVDISRCLHALDTGDGGAAGLAALRRGRTPFSSLAFALRLADGVVAIEDATMGGPDVVASATGTADIGRRALALGIIAALPGSLPGSGAPGTQLAVGLAGSFDAPVVDPRVVTSHDAVSRAPKAPR